MKILPKRKRDWDLFPISKIDENSIEIFFDGVIEISQQEFQGLENGTHCFSDDLKSVIVWNKTVEEQTESKRQIEQQKNLAELSELEHWFTWYDNQVVQFNRAVRLGEPFDNNIIELDLQAKANAERLKQLKAALNQ